MDMDYSSAADIVFDCSGSDLLAGERCKPEDKGIIYRKLCEAGRILQYHDGVLTQTDPLRKALETALSCINAGVSIHPDSECARMIRDAVERKGV